MVIYLVGGWFQPIWKIRFIFPNFRGEIFPKIFELPPPRNHHLVMFMISFYCLGFLTKPPNLQGAFVSWTLDPKNHGNRSPLSQPCQGSQGAVLGYTSPPPWDVGGGALQDSPGTCEFVLWILVRASNNPPKGWVQAPFPKQGTPHLRLRHLVFFSVTSFYAGDLRCILEISK